MTLPNPQAGMGELRDRAKRIAEIRTVRRMWADGIVWRNHLTASHEFQLLDVLRDIRLALTLILVVLVLGYCGQKPGITVVLSDQAEAA